MKKILILFTLFACGFGAMAQLPLHVGIHGGMSSNRIKIKEIPKAIGTQAHSGYMLGAFARVDLGKIYIEPSFNYSHKESVVEISSEAGNNQNLKINSFDIPLMLGMQVLDLRLIKFRAYLGPVVSFPKLKDLKEVSNLDSEKTNWHGKIGVGADIWKLTFDIDYEKAFKDLGEQLKAPRSFNFTLGLKII